MRSDFSPIIGLLAVLWFLIGIPISIAKKNAAQKKPPVRRTAPEAQAGTPSRDERKPAPEPERLTTMAPTISVTEHDDSVYQGSLNAFTGEGYDPCHDAQMETLSLAGEEDFTPRTERARVGIPLGWTDNDMVRGIIMSEILNRKK